MEEKTRTENITMVNVYQVAADIGNDFEHLIEKFGSDGFRDIMPKIIKSLECLEEAVKLIDKQQENLSNLEEQVMKLEQESATKEEEKIKLIQDAEEAAEKKREDDVFWMKQLSELQNENSLLMQQISEKEGLAIKERVQEQEAVKVLMVMKQTVEKQRNQLRTLEKEVSQKTVDVDALQEQVERLAKLNQSLHQKNELIQAHAQSLMKEKSQIISEMKAMEKDMPLQNSTSQEESTQNSDHTSQTQVDGQSTDGMIMINPKDPNRPRFTLHELYQVLLERDELKLKLFLLEEDLKSNKETKTQQIPPREDQKSEYSISKFFSSLFKSNKKRSKPVQKENDSGSSENNWEFLEKEDAPVKAELKQDSPCENVSEPPQSVFKVFEKYHTPQENELEMKEMVEDHFLRDKNDGDVSSKDGGISSSEDEERTSDVVASSRHFVEDEGTDVDFRDENCNVNIKNTDSKTKEDSSLRESGHSTEAAASAGGDETVLKEDSSDHLQPSNGDYVTKEKEMGSSCDVVEL